MKKEIGKALCEHLPSAKWVAISPGRVNLLGGHVDYNHGLVLPAAIDRYVQVGFSARADRRVKIYSIDLDAAVQFSIADIGARVDLRGAPLPHWAQYIAAVAWSLLQEGFLPAGMDAVIRSNLPIGAGLSSSAAVELAFAAAWQKLGDFKIPRMRLAQVCQRAENAYVGVQCGLMDQFAVAHGVARHALAFDTRSLSWQPIPLPLNTAIVIADSAVERELSNSAYNQRRQECRDGLSAAKIVFPQVQSLRDLDPQDLPELQGNMPAHVFKRVHHVVEEIARVEQGCRCLINDHAVSFGRLMNASHASLRDLFEVSTPALDRLVAVARSLPGVFGARLTGAGFGGCTVNLVESAHAERVAQGIHARFQQQTGIDVKVHICKPSRGVHVEAIK